MKFQMLLAGLSIQIQILVIIGALLTSSCGQKPEEAPSTPASEVGTFEKCQASKRTKATLINTGDMVTLKMVLYSSPSCDSKPLFAQTVVWKVINTSIQDDGSKKLISVVQAMQIVAEDQTSAESLKKTYNKDFPVGEPVDIEVNANSETVSIFKMASKNRLVIYSETNKEEEPLELDRV